MKKSEISAHVLHSIKILCNICGCYYIYYKIFLGPFRFVDTYGAGNLVKLMEKFQKLIGESQFQPAQLLLDHAKNPSKKFHVK